MRNKLILSVLLLFGAFTLSAQPPNDGGAHRFQNLTQEERDELKAKRDEIREMRMKMRDDHMQQQRDRVRDPSTHDDNGG